MCKISGCSGVNLLDRWFLKMDLFLSILGLKQWIFPRSCTDARCDFLCIFLCIPVIRCVVNFLQWHQGFSSARCSEKGHDTRLGSGWDKGADPFVLGMQTGSVFLSAKSACSSNVCHQTVLDVLFWCIDFFKKNSFTVKGGSSKGLKPKKIS